VRKAFCRILFVAVGGVAVAGGCTPDAYRDDADLQVGSLVRDREKQTLTYAPKVEIDDKPTPAAPHHPYEKIPASPVPVATGSPLESTKTELAWGRLGPENFLPGQRPVELPDYFDLTGARTRTSQSMRFGPPNPTYHPNRFDLFRSLTYATNHSREYENAMESVYLAALDVTLQRHLLYDPHPFVTQTVGFGGNQALGNQALGDVRYRSALSATTSAGVKQKLPYGGEVVASSMVSFVDALNNSTENGESAQLALSASIPLLRGAGLVNLEPVISSERNLVYVVRNFEEYRREFVVDVASSYFNLVTAQREVQNRRNNVATFASLTDRTLALYVAGRLKFLDVQRSYASQIAAESDLVSSMESYQATLDAFKIQIGMNPEDDLDIVPVELETAVPAVDLDDAVALALQYRLDLQTGRDRVDDARRQVKVAENGLLPDLTLNSNGAVGNPVGSPAVSLNSQTTSYGASVTLDLPIDRLAERNVYRASLLQLQQSQRSFETLKDGVAVDARNALRRIRSAQTSLSLNERAIDVANKRLAYSLELLKQGAIDSRDVVDAQSALLAAQDQYDQARAQLQIQVLRYFKATGTLRIDPSAGALGRALDRAPAPADRSLVIQ
jgi:outer membrane protein TolC